MKEKCYVAAIVYIQLAVLETLILAVAAVAGKSQGKHFFSFQFERGNKD